MRQAPPGRLQDIRIDYGEAGGGCGFYNQSDVCARPSLGIGDTGQLRSVHCSRADLRLNEHTP
jgi:hypothetical protein